jgi:flagellar motility protein MotE (MotC chaperone)
MIAILVIFMGMRTVDLWSGVETTMAGISPAMAADNKAATSHSAPSGGADGHGAGDAPRGAVTQSGYMSAADVDVMNSIEDRDAKFASWEEELKVRERLLEVTEGKVEAKIAELRELETSLKKLVGMQSEKEEAALNRLVKIYESMKPQDAAPIIQRLDEDTQLAIAGRMKESKLAAIFAKMEDDTPQNLTVRMMDRSEMPPELLQGN